MSETATEQSSDVEAGHDSRRLWALVVFAYVALDGAALQMRGAVVPSLREAFAVTESQLGLVAPAGTLGFVLVVTVVGAVAEQFDTRRLLLLGVAGTGLGVLSMGLAPSFLLFLVGVAGRSLFVGVGRGSDRPLLSHLYPTQRGRLFSYYDMMWAVGATMGPLLVAAAIWAGNWRFAYGALAVAFVPVVAALLWLSPPVVDGGDDPLDPAELRRIVRRPEVLATAVGLFLSAGVEGGLFTWLTTFAEGRLAGSLSTTSLSVLLVAYVPGRFATGRLAERFGYAPMATGLLCLAIPAVAYTFFLASGLALLVGFFAIGLTLSGLYPTLLAYATEAVPEHSAPINALVLLTSTVGLALVPAAMGFVIEGAGVVRAMRLLLAPLAALLAVVVTTWLTVGQPADTA